MSVKIRLTKIGKRNQIQYRIVAQDTRTKRDGKFLEILGNFNPFETGEKLTLKKDEYTAWIKKGAKPTPSLSYLMENGKLPKKAKKVKVEANSPDQKPPETKAEKPVAQNEEAPQELQTNEETTQKPEQSENKPAPEESKEDAQPAIENVESEQAENSETEDPQQPKANPPPEETINN